MRREKKNSRRSWEEYRILYTTVCAVQGQTPNSASRGSLSQPNAGYGRRFDSRIAGPNSVCVVDARGLRTSRNPKLMMMMFKEDT